LWGVTNVVLARVRHPKLKPPGPKPTDPSAI
jgi:hypothetical protein